MRARVLAPCVVVMMAAAAPPTVAGSGHRDRPVAASATDQPQHGVGLTLEEARSRALEANLLLAAGRLAESAAAARVVQAGLLPNPELEVEAENFGGGRDLRGYDAAETTVAVSQRILLGGKRGHRRAVARSEQTLAGRELAALRVDVLAETTSAFYRVVAAQQRVRLAEDMLDLTEQVAAAIQARVDAGKVSPVDATRARIEVAGARVQLTRAGRALGTSRAALAARWGSPRPDFEDAVGLLPEPAQRPELDVLRQRLGDAPRVRRLDDLVQRQRNVVAFERSQRIPDLTVSVGPRRFEDTGQSAWVAGLSVPIPIFDRNQGARRAAELDLRRIEHESAADRVDLEVRLASLVEELEAAAVEVATTGLDMVPAAEAAFEAARIGYREGKLGFLDVLEAQRALFDARALHLDGREAYAVTLTELERLVGGPVTAADGSFGTNGGDAR